MYLHCDGDRFFASVSIRHLQKKYPRKYSDLHRKPVVISGDDKRGIVVACNDPAKRLGIKTTDPVYMVKKRFENIVYLKPDFDLYLAYSEKLNDIYRDYTDRVKVFSIDESWLDISGVTHLFGTPWEIAEKISGRVVEELGITISIGGYPDSVIIAKMATEINKPKGITIIQDRKEYVEIFHKKGVEELYGVGDATREKLKKLGIVLIGELAALESAYIKSLLGTNGLFLWKLANGVDKTSFDDISAGATKGIGNSMTFKEDTDDIEKLKKYLLRLSEQVSWRLRLQGYRCGVIQVTIRYADFSQVQRQTTLPMETDITEDIYETSLSLFQENWNGNKVRLLGIRTGKLIDAKGFIQLGLINKNSYIKKRDLASCIDGIRKKYGTESVFRATLMDDDLHRKRFHEKGGLQ